MKLSLLLDLDNTILENEMDTFLPVYFHALSRKFPQWPPDQFIQKLLTATQAMVRKSLPNHTLEEAFDRVFYPSLGVKKAEVSELLAGFYANEFGNLGSHTRPRPGAKELVDRAQAAGMDLVIATNPVFPRAALLHRLRWAGFTDLEPFRLLTSYEKFHFSKPNPEYYAEILAQLGCPDQPAVMVGDNLEEDLVPATKIGIAGYLVTDHPVALPRDLIVPIQQGPIDQAWDWIHQISEQLNVPPASGSPQSILPILKATPAALETVCQDLKPEQWLNRPAPAEWAVAEVLCHLRDVDREVNFPRIRQISAGESPFLPGMVTDPWAEERNYIHQSGPDALTSFMDIRCDMTELLNRLSQDGWNTTARHAIFGPTTLVELVSFMATHDIVHIRQVFQTIAS
jgi:HAD superfamily hydrolase (TIGR01549 family)